MPPLDGSAIAGALQDAFGDEMTTRTGLCEAERPQSRLQGSGSGTHGAMPSTPTRGASPSAKLTSR
jgi:hypothetical protein